jgi:hypothetical protein
VTPGSPGVFPARISRWDGASGLADAGGRSFPFTATDVVGFHPVAGLEALVEVSDDGSLLRLTLPGHPVRAEPSPGRAFGWVTALAPQPVGPDAIAWRALLGAALPPGARLGVQELQDRDTLLEARWPGAHVLLRERPFRDPEGLERRLLPLSTTLPPVGWELLPTPVLPGEERRLLGVEAQDPWAEDGAARRTGRWVRALLAGGASHLVVEHAGRLVLLAAEAEQRFGDPEDLQARPFGALIDWALEPGHAHYRTLGMAAAGGEDVEVAITHPTSEVELDSAESALLFACHLQVRQGRLLEDGEVFYVPKDVRIGPRGATAAARTGYKYLVRRGRARVELQRG